MRKEISPTGDYNHMDEGALETRYSEEAAGHPTALRIGVRRAVAIGALTAAGLISYFGIPKAMDVLHNSDEAAHQAAAGRVVPGTEAGQIQAAQQAIQKNEASQDAANHQP